MTVHHIGEFSLHPLLRDTGLSEIEIRYEHGVRDEAVMQRECSIINQAIRASLQSDGFTILPERPENVETHRRGWHRIEFQSKGSNHSLPESLNKAVRAAATALDEHHRQVIINASSQLGIVLSPSQQNQLARHITESLGMNNTPQIS